MIKYVQCIRRRPDVAVPEFRKRWAAYVEAIGPAAQRLGAKRFSTTTTLAVEENQKIRDRRGTDEPFDGMVEIYFQSGARTVQTILSDHKRVEATEEMFRVLSGFADLGGSAVFWAQDEDE